MTAHEALLHALGDLERAGQSWPCRSSDSDLWISDRAEEREAAAYRCAPCPVLTLCSDAAAELKATAGVWAGIPRGQSAQRGTKACA